MQWVLLTILGLLSFSVQATTLNIATGDYPPFTDASKPNQGSLVAYTEEILNNSAIKQNTSSCLGSVL